MVKFTSGIKVKSLEDVMYIDTVPSIAMLMKSMIESSVDYPYSENIDQYFSLYKGSTPPSKMMKGSGRTFWRLKYSKYQRQYKRYFHNYGLGLMGEKVVEEYIGRDRLENVVHDYFNLSDIFLICLNYCHREKFMASEVKKWKREVMNPTLQKWGRDFSTQKEFMDWIDSIASKDKSRVGKTEVRNDVDNIKQKLFEDV